MPHSKKTMKLTKQMEEFYNKLNGFVEDFIVGGYDPADWEKDDFKKFFIENMPKTPKVKIPKVKDPSEPKKAKGPYIFFSSDPEIRQTIKDENPNSSPTEVMKLIGALWSSDDYKNYHDDGENKDKNGNRFDYTELASKYITMAVDDKERYFKEMESYTPDPNLSVNIKIKKKKPTSKSAYMFFCQEFRADAKSSLAEEYSGKELQTEVMKCLGKWWNDGYKEYTDNGDCKDKEGRRFKYTEKSQRFLDMAIEDKERSLESSDDEIEEEFQDNLVEKKIFKQIKVRSKKVINIKTPNHSPPPSQPYIDRGFNGGGFD